MGENSNFANGLNRNAGIVFNQATVESQMSKCSYVYDGATDRRLNGGCGCGADGAASCANVLCAFNDNDCAYSDPFDTNVCRQHCQNGDPECVNATPDTYYVETCYCSSPHLVPGYDTASTLTPQCYFKAPNFYNGTSSSDETRDMLKRRVQSQWAHPVNEPVGDQTRYKPGYWTEVVLDGRVVFEKLNSRPAEAIVAFIYKKNDAVAKLFATTMAQTMQTEYGMTQPVPLVAFDTTVNVTTTPPFSFESSSEVFI